jgi:hypothetical protein
MLFLYMADTKINLQLLQPMIYFITSISHWYGSISTFTHFLNKDYEGVMMLEDWLLSLMSTLVMGFGPED